MKLQWVMVLVIAASGAQFCDAQSANVSSPKTFVCDLVFQGQQESKGCSHKYVDGQIFKTIYWNGMVITVGIDDYAQYMRATILISNNNTVSVDLLPSDFAIEVSTPKAKILHYISAEKIAESEAKHAASRNSWSLLFAGMANGLSSAAAATATQESTTETTTTGTVNATSSDGTYTTGTYNGTSTSTTSTPDYAAQQQAAEEMRQRNMAIVAANAQRNASVAASNAQLFQTALSANTIAPGGVIGGYVYFEGDKKADIVTLQIPIAGALYEFKFKFEFN